MRDLLRYIQRCVGCEGESGAFENGRGPQGLTGETGPQGDTGAAGLNGSGVNPVLSTLDPGGVCECGGTHVDLYGVDGENDGIIIGSFDICNGCNGADASDIAPFPYFLETIADPTDTDIFDATGLGLDGTGSAKPNYDGWAIANGQNGTFDRRGTFAVQYSDSDVIFSTVTGSGGAKTVTLAKANLPTHQHTISTTTTDSGTVTVAGGNHTHTYKNWPNQGSSGLTDGAVTTQNDVETSQTTTGTGAHTHTLTGNSGNGVSDGLIATPINKLPPYKVLLILQKL